MKVLSPDKVSFLEIFFLDGHKASGFRCVNVIIGNIDDETISSIFGPLEGNEEFVTFDNKIMWCHVLKELGIFDSVNLARKNGWNKAIKSGFSEAVFKKQRKVVFMFNQETMDD